MKSLIPSQYYALKIKLSNKPNSRINHIIAACYVLCLLLSLPTVAFAQGDAVLGKEKSQLCQGCHGADGNSYGPDWPNLASQHTSYLTKQIRNFKNGSRKNETMNSMVANLSGQDINDIAAFFTAQPVVQQEVLNEEKVNAELIKTGRKIYKGGNRYSGVPACAGCHGPNAAGNGPAAFPYLAGQKLSYLIKTLKDFKSGSRANDPNEIMRNIAAKLTVSEITAVATYVAKLQQQK
jgi:cytochrome c553